MTEEMCTMNGYNRPQTRKGLFCATESDAECIDMLGGHTCHGVAMTDDQLRAIRSLYEYTEASPDIMAEAHDIRDMLRHAQADGLRLVAYLAGHCEPGDDPVELVSRALASLGYDVDFCG